MCNIRQIRVGTETTFTHVLGVANIEGKRHFAILGLVSRRSGMDYMLPVLHRGEDISDEENKFHSLGQRRYVAKRGNMDDGLVQALIIPTSNAVQDHTGDESDIDKVRIILWHGDSPTDDMIWANIAQTPIPLLPHWQAPIMEVLKDDVRLDVLRERAGIPPRKVSRISDIHYEVTDGLWGGAVLHVDDDDIAVASQHLLRNCTITMEAPCC